MRALVDLSTRARALVVVGALIVGSGAFLLFVLRASVDNLDQSIASTQEIADGNVRTIGQAQRELLQLDLLITSGSDDAELMELQRSFVGQRMQELTLPYQASTLGGVEQLRETRELRTTWQEELAPIVAEITRSPDDDDDGPRARLRVGVQALEARLNDLLAMAENNRKVDAAAANSASKRLLRLTDVITQAVLATWTAFLLFAVASTRALVVTERRRQGTLDELREAYSELQKASQVAQHTRNAVVITDERGVVDWSNRAFEELVRVDGGRARGRLLHDLLPSSPLPSADVDADVHDPAGPSDDLAELEVRTGDGERRAMSVETLVVAAAEDPPTEDLPPTSYIRIYDDITARREAELHLMAARAAAEDTISAKAAFLSMVSHEMRTPLHAIVGMTEVLSRTPMSEAQQRYLEIVQRNATELTAVVDDILTFSVLEEGTMALDLRAVDVGALVEGVARSFGPQAEAKGLTLTIDVASEERLVAMCDERRVGQIVSNVIANAVEFTERDGIAVCVEPLAPDDPDGFSIRVTDTGIGIDDASLARVREPFSRLDTQVIRRGGTGLGLAISDRLARAMGGRLDIRSALGVGTEVRLVLHTPRVRDAELAPAEPIAPTRTDSLSDLRVLIAEDDPLNLEVLGLLLGQLGIAPARAVNGQAALDHIGAEPTDVVLMDINMPVLDGLTAICRLCEERSPARRPWLIAVTANAIRGDRERFLDAGADGYLSKPVLLDELAEQLGSALMGLRERRSTIG